MSTILFALNESNPGAIIKWDHKIIDGNRVILSTNKFWQHSLYGNCKEKTYKKENLIYIYVDMIEMDEQIK